MINSGKCPKCQKVISCVKIEGVDVKEGFESRWRGVSYYCPHCYTILSVQIDPIAVQTDTVDDIVEKLKK